MAATFWLDTYNSALIIRDAREQALKSTYSAYARLADRSSSLNPHPSPCLQTPTPSTPSRPASSSTTIAHSPSSLPANFLTDLTAAQTARTQLTTHLTSLTALHTTLTSTHTQTLSQLSSQKSLYATLNRRVKDLEEELEGKRKLLEEVQDELVAAEMQVNVAEGRREDVERENKELVGRLVEGRKGWEGLRDGLGP